MWYRHRRNRVQLPTSQDLEEESIPLTTRQEDAFDDGEMERKRKAKGKDKATDGEEDGARVRGVQEAERIFEVGDSDEDDYKYNK